jgi:hypothetical protein
MGKRLKLAATVGTCIGVLTAAFTLNLPFTWSLAASVGAFVLGIVLTLAVTRGHK